jgi:hypothetical protein
MGKIAYGAKAGLYFGVGLLQFALFVTSRSPPIILPLVGMACFVLSGMYLSKCFATPPAGPGERRG